MDLHSGRSRAWRTINIISYLLNYFPLLILPTLSCQSYSLPLSFSTRSLSSPVLQVVSELQPVRPPCSCRHPSVANIHFSPPAILFAKAGAHVIVSARRKDKLDEVCKAAQAANKEGGTGHGGKCVPLVLDVSDRKAADSEWLISCVAVILKGKLT